jgi:hypothetical protein
MKIAVTLGILASLMFARPGAAAEVLPAIKGQVIDSSGTPVAGALVVAIAASSSVGDRMAFTDSHGLFSIPNLLVGQYSVKVSMSRFLPVLRNGIQLANGTTAILNLNLQTAMDVFRRVTSGGKSAEDMVWVLRSSRATQPVMRLLGQDADDSPAALDYSGYLQVYSKSVESSGSTADSVGSSFSLTMPLQNHAKVTVDGQYNESADQPRGISATYAFAPANKHQSQVSLSMRQSALLNGTMSPDNLKDSGDSLKEIQIKYNEKLQLMNHLVFSYSAETGRTVGLTRDEYFRPGVKISFVPNSQTTFGAEATAEAPSRPDDPIRGKEYFEQQAMLPLSHQNYRHAEANASRIVSGTTKISGAIFKDQSATQMLFVTMPDGSRRFVILDGRGAGSNGMRLFVDREFKNFDAGIGYTVATAQVFAKGTNESSIGEQMSQRQLHVVTARIKTDLDITNTQLTAVYRWVSPFAAAPVDPYQTNVEYNDPTLSITVAQNLPTWGMFPGKVQAILDARNLLEQSANGHTTQISISPRFVKGGINIRF